jgi:raffinose/stachyose/melibiose transport system substrate-binding protein
VTTSVQSKRISRRQLIKAGAVVAGAAAVLPILSACAPQPAVAPAQASPAAGGASAPAKNVEIVYLNQSRGQAKVMETLAEKYTKEKGIKVTIDSPGPIDYPKKLQAASQAGTMPDMYYAIGAGDMAPYYKAGLALDLKAELDKGWKKNFQPIILELNEFKAGNPNEVPPGIYSAPWEGNSYGLLYNPALFEKAKLDPKKLPATTPDFMAAAKALKAAGVGPLIMAAEFIPTFVQSYVSNYLTDDEIDATQAGKTSWKSDAYRKTLQLYADLRDAGVVFGNAFNQPNAECEKSFFNVQEVALIYTGVFSVPVQVTTAPNFKEYSSFPLPKAADAKQNPRSFGGGGKNGVVHAKGKNVEESLKYIKWLTEKEQEQVMMEMVPLVPTNPDAADPAKILPQLKMFAEEIARIQKVPTPRPARVNEAFTKGVQSLLLKEKTVDQILDDVDKAQKG